MNPLTAEWVDKAEGDYASAGRERRARVYPNHDSACFHAQQCDEKYLKAALTEAGIPFGKTHDLEKLLDLCLPAHPAWAVLRPQLMWLGAYAVAFRYPGSSQPLLRPQLQYSQFESCERTFEPHSPCLYSRSSSEQRGRGAPLLEAARRVSLVVSP